MMIRKILFALLAFLGAPALAQQAPQAPPPVYKTVAVRLHTRAGDILLALEIDRAPISAGNFLHYVDTKRLDGSEFYRAMHTAADAGLIQGGVRDGNKLFPPVGHEPTSQTGLSHVDGAISVPRLAVGTARGDFTIMVGNQPYLDAGPGSAGDGLGYAVFGRVVEGMEVVRAILAAPTSATEGEGVMKGQMLAPRIKILTARRVAKPR
jgi:peptidyl-prolyl cis-trans isomerase A (cyclophilin A)